TIRLVDADDFSRSAAYKDGRISKKEYVDAVIKSFHKLDRNRDGFLTKDELKTIDKIDAEKFVKEEDINEDGKISKEEFIKAARKRFKLLDKNNDGFIDQKEWTDVKYGVNPRNSRSSSVSPLMIFSF
ncbi:MAG: EF-hand domain-containing protein, partial [Syntrophales bacterium LBB04]|nr:EF-hand domain-containing protein [Syntrophales bacterium LBB04]